MKKLSEVFDDYFSVSDIIAGFLLLAILALGIWILTWPSPPEPTAKDLRIEQIMSSVEFKQKAQEEAEKIYYKEVLNEAQQGLETLDKGGFREQEAKAAALEAYLQGKGKTELVAHVLHIVTLPRWVEAVAIASKETSLCTAGVGSSRNNCGAIKNKKGEFKTYASKLEAIEDISLLLTQPRYADKTIAQMNGLYCVEEKVDNGHCAGWTEHIEKQIAEIKTLAYAGGKLQK